jgi:hypothetical protein
MLLLRFAAHAFESIDLPVFTGSFAFCTRRFQRTAQDRPPEWTSPSKVEAFLPCNINTLQLTLRSLSLWWNVGSSAEDIIRRLKGNTGACLRRYSGAVPATVIHFLLLAINRHCLRNGKREGASNVESQETCRHRPKFIRAFG